MRLLLDANISPALARSLADIFPGSVHVFACGRISGDDRLIWQYAMDHGLTILTKDADFQSLSLVLGPPPKVVWLRAGNASTSIIE